MTAESVRLDADSELVARAQRGDRDAMHDLLALLRPWVLRFCRYRLASYAGGTDAADDAAQDTCLAVATVLPSFRDQGLPFAAWVYGIAGHKVADVQRRYGRAADVVEDLPERAEPSRNPEELAVVAAELREALVLVDSLPVGMREVLMRRATGATAKMVAADLGMSAGAVNVAYHRAVTRLCQTVDASEEYRELFAAFRTPDTARPLGFAA